MRDILYIDEDPTLGVQGLFDADVIGLPITIEYTLRCVWNALKPGTYSNSYPWVLKDDPWFKWVNESRDNYEELWGYGMDIIDEHMHRFGSRQVTRYNHGSLGQMERLGVLPDMLPIIGLTPKPVSIEQAREAYANESKKGSKFITFTHRERPSWL